MEINRTKIDYIPRSQYIKNGSAGTSSSSVTTTDNSALAYINNLFTYDAENQSIRANYNLYGVGEISAYGLGSTGGTGGGTSYNRLDLWDDYGVDKAGYVLSAYLGSDLNSRLIAVENNSTTTISFANITGKPTTLSGYGITDALNINGVASSATKLASVRTIYGQNFDGTQNIYGTIKDVDTIQFSSSYYPTTYVWANNNGLHLNCNSGNELGLSISPSQNVRIGTSTDAGYKLDVNGTTRIFGGLHLNSEGWLQLYNGNNTSTISLSHNNASSKLDIYNRTLGNWANVEAGFLTVDTITMKNNQSEKFIRSNAFGGAIRLRSDGASAVDRGLQLGRVDNNLSFSSFMAINADSGNVSIGSTADNGYKLDVIGSTRISGSLSLTDTIIRSNAYAVDSDVYGNLNWKTGAENWYNWNVGGIMCVFKSGNVMVGSTTDSGFKLDVNGIGKFNNELYLTNGLRIDNAAGSGAGISLFAEPSVNPNYGLMFARTIYKGTHGSVNGDWATYFTMSPDAGRGWIFTSNAAGTGGNVASISNWGNLTCSGEVTAYSASDIRLKTNIKPIMSAIDVINKLNPVQYNWNTLAKELNPLKTDNTEYGLIAQELEVVMPELVHEIYNEYKSIDYVKLVPILIKAVQELKSETDFQQKQINELKQNRWLS